MRPSWCSHKAKKWYKTSFKPFQTGGLLMSTPRPSPQLTHSPHENPLSYDHHTWPLFVNREHFKAVRVLIAMFFKICIFSTKKCLFSILTYSWTTPPRLPRGQKKVAVVERWPLWAGGGGEGCNMTPFLYFRKVQPVYFAKLMLTVAYNGSLIVYRLAVTNG